MRKTEMQGHASLLQFIITTMDRESDKDRKEMGIAFLNLERERGMGESRNEGGFIRGKKFLGERAIIKQD